MNVRMDTQQELSTLLFKYTKIHNHINTDVHQIWKVDVTGDYLDATRAKVIAELQVKNGSSWIPVAIWTEDQYNYKVRLVETHDVVKGHTYRVKGTFMVWEGSAYETEYDFSDEITA